MSCTCFLDRQDRQFENAVDETSPLFTGNRPIRLSSVNFDMGVVGDRYSRCDPRPVFAIRHRSAIIHNKKCNYTDKE